MPLTPIMRLACFTLLLQWTAINFAHAVDTANIGLDRARATTGPQIPPLTSNNHARILRRNFDIDVQADDDKWRKYVEKGKKFLCAMRATDKGAGFLLNDQRKPPSAASPWKGDLKNELRLWSWIDQPYDFAHDKPCDWEGSRLGPGFLGFGLNPKPKYAEHHRRLEDGENECFNVRHRTVLGFDTPIEEQRYTVNGKEYECSSAHYSFGINTRDGGIMVASVFGPKFHWMDTKPLSEYPELRHCSDILMGHWQRDNPNVRNLRVFVAQTVVNEDATALVARAFHNMDIGGLSPWPGNTIDMSTDEGKAILGSPLGAIMANLLIRNKLVLGIKHIIRVTVMTDTPFPKGDPRYDPLYDDPAGAWAMTDMHLFFLIEDVPPDQIPDDDDEEITPQVRNKVQAVYNANGKNAAAFGGKNVKVPSMHESLGGSNVLRVHKIEVAV